MPLLIPTLSWYGEPGEIPGPQAAGIAEIDPSDGLPALLRHPEQGPPGRRDPGPDIPCGKPAPPPGCGYPVNREWVSGSERPTARPAGCTPRNWPICSSARKKGLLGQLLRQYRVPAQGQRKSVDVLQIVPVNFFKIDHALTSLSTDKTASPPFSLQKIHRHFWRWIFLFPIFLISLLQDLHDIPDHAVVAVTQDMGSPSPSPPGHSWQGQRGRRTVPSWGCRSGCLPRSRYFLGRSPASGPAGPPFPPCCTHGR